MLLKVVAAGLLCLAETSQAFRTSLSLRDIRADMAKKRLRARDIDPSELYPAHTLSVPIDHFHNDSRYEPHSNGSFDLRYWFDPTYYKAGGPIIVLQSGEDSGVDRLPYLQKGILTQLAQATGGMGVVLEHRYYGDSFPVPDLSTANLRFLTTDQAMADMVYFAQNIVFPGFESVDLTAGKNAYIAYGGSYAGAFVAILRKLYPDVYWGAISSSGVVEAIYDYWQYYEAIRIYGPPDCVSTTQKLTNMVDNILIGKKCTTWPQKLKEAFGLGNLTSNQDFASAISGGVAGLQSTNWDPSQNSTSLGRYCDTISSDAVLYPAAESQRAAATDLLNAGGYGNQTDALINRLLNYIGYINQTVVSGCARSHETQDQCLTSFDTAFYEQDDINQTWRSWPYQYCTQWGFLQTGSGVPATQLPMISRLIDLNYTSVVCRDAFNITTPSDVESINVHGGFGISYPRLAIIDGEHDPWRAATPHAIGQPQRFNNSASEPFHLIKDAVHHWDENGLFPNQTTADLPPQPVADTQAIEALAVQSWMVEWQLHCAVDGGC